MFDFSFDLGTLVPSLVLALLAVVLPMLFRRIADGFLRRTKPHMASWLHILLESYVFPLAMILRVFLFLLAISMLPFVFVTDAKFQNVLDVGSALRRWTAWVCQSAVC